MQHRPDTRHDGAGARPPRMSVGARRRAGDPPALAARQRRSSIEACGKLGSHPRTTARHSRHEPHVLRGCFGVEQAHVDAQACALQALGAAALRRVRIAHRGNDTCDPGVDNGICARRRSSLARAGLERHVKRRAVRVVSARTRIGERRHFRMRFAGDCMPAFADHVPIFHDHAADARVRRRRVEAALGKRERARHVAPVVIGKIGLRHAGRRSGLRGARTASTSFSASRKSDTSWNDRYTEANRM